MVRLRVLGLIELQDADGRGVDAVLAQPKRLALLVYLAVAGSRFHRRDSLLALFWPELDESHARDALNSAVRFLRRALGQGSIVSRADELGIDPDRLWCDAAAFREHAQAGRGGEALELYRGDLIDGVFASGCRGFEEWLERERARLRATAANVARALAESREEEQSFTMAVSIARRAVELSDTDERVVRELLELLDRLGDRAGALHAYEAFSARLARDLEADPAPETAALIARIRARTVPTGSQAIGEDASMARGASRADSGLQKLNGWQLVRELGRGGMSTVYLARDAKHDRHVALKAFRSEIAISLGTDRFLREIQITAQLAHPHILPLIDSGAAEGVLYLITPYVPGESLRARLMRERHLSVSDALRIASEVAEALDYAHRSGIIHRDIKPENILLADGHAIVADFGVARAILASSGGAAEWRDEGALIGSPPYMSPEAAERRPVDARTDVYSLGCVLLEMLTGEMPDVAESSPRRLARHRELDAPLRRLIADCLAARPDDRIASTGEVLNRIQSLRSSPTTVRTSTLRRGTIVGVLAASLVAGFVLVSKQSTASTIAIGGTSKLTNTPDLELDPAISPDGKLVAYTGGTPRRMRIYVRQIAGGRTIEVSGNTKRLHRWPVWSPDGTAIAFIASDGDRLGPEASVFVVPALGGAPRLIDQGLMYFATPAWSPDGNRLAYPSGDSIVIRGLRDGDRRAFASRPVPHSIAWSPDGKRLAYVSGNPLYTFGTTAFGNLSPSSIWTVRADGTEGAPVSQDKYLALSPVWTRDSRALLYISNADGAFDVYQSEIDGNGRAEHAPRRLTIGLNAHGISLSPDGSRLAYSVLDYRSNIFSAPINASGPTLETSIRQVTDENRTIETADVTLDGQWLVFDSNRNGRSHIFKMRVAGGDPIQLTDAADDDFAPRWSPDGKRITFHSRRGGVSGRDIYVMNADGRDVVQITADSLDENYPRFTADGRAIHFTVANTLMMVSQQPDGTWGAPTPYRGGPGRGGAVWTVDGKAVMQHGKDGIYAKIAGGQAKVLVKNAQLHGRITTMATGPDPSLFYFRLIDTTGVHSFYAVPVTGGTPRLLLRLEEKSRQAARIIFSTDSRRLYFTLTDAESDIWVMTLQHP